MKSANSRQFFYFRFRRPGRQLVLAFLIFRVGARLRFALVFIPNILRASAGVAISRPTSREMRTIFSTSWAFDLAYSPALKNGLSSMPTRTWPPSKIAIVKIRQCSWGSITLVL